MPTGKISGIVKRNGYGFVETDSDPRIFFHQRWLEGVRFRELRVGDEVIFQLDQGPRGPRARNLTLLSRASDQKRREFERTPAFTASAGPKGLARSRGARQNGVATREMSPRQRMRNSWREKLASLFRD